MTTTEESSGRHSAIARLFPWIIAGLAIFALALVLSRGYWDGQRSAEATELAELKARLAAVEQGGGKQQGKNDATLFGSAAGRGVPTGGNGSAQGGSSVVLAADNLTPAEREAEKRRMERQLQSEFENDAADPAGGVQMESRLEDTAVGRDMAGTGIVPKDVVVDCRKTLCRVSADFANAGDAEDWAVMYLSAAGGAIVRARTVQARQPDGSTRLVLYGVQEGRGK